MGLLDRPQQAQRFGLLSPDVMQLIQSGGPRVAPAPVAPAAPARRERVSGWRVLDRVLGGETVSEGLDAERARLQAEAMRPQNEARAAFVRAHAMALGPVAEAALALNPEEYGKAMSTNLEGYTLGAGGVRGGVNGQVASAPTFTPVNDTIYRNDPGAGTSVPTATAPAAFSDMVADFNARNPVVPANSTWMNESGGVRGRGYIPPNVTTLAPGTQGVVTNPDGDITNRFGSTQERPVNPALLKRADDLELALTADENSIARVQSALALITDPDGRGPARAPVRVGPWENFGAGFLNATGMSNDNSLGIAQLITTAESLRQGILNDATGPQTEGDALRALNSILAGRNDPAVIRQGFNDYLAAKRRTAAVRRRQMEELRAGGGQPAPAAPASPGSGVSVEAARAELRRRGVNP